MSTFKIDIPTGAFWSDEEAQQIAPLIAAAHQGRFTGRWSTIVPNETSMVEVELSSTRTGSNTFTTHVLAGPIWGNDEARKVGPYIAASYGAAFTGRWRTLVEGVMSVIEVEYRF